MYWSGAAPSNALRAPAITQARGGARRPERRTERNFRSSFSGQHHKSRSRTHQNENCWLTEEVARCARRVVGEFVEHYNTARLHSALGYVTPGDRLEGRHLATCQARDQKLEAARQRRCARRERAEIKL